MKVKVSEATKNQINWLVAKCNNHQWRCAWMLEKNGYAAWQSYEAAWGNPTPDYSTDWSQGGPIIENHIFRLEDFAGEGWSAFGLDGAEGEGSTPLIAAMRCYVVSKLGEEVEVPDDLA